MKLYEMLEIAESLPFKKVLNLSIYYFSELTQEVQVETATLKIEPDKDIDIFTFVREQLPKDFSCNFTIHASRTRARVYYNQYFNVLVVQHCLNFPMYTPLVIIVNREKLLEEGYDFV